MNNQLHSAHIIVKIRKKEEIHPKKYPHFIVPRKALFNVDNVDNLKPKQIFADFYNISGPHGYQQIAAGAIFQQKVFDFVKRRKIGTFFSEPADLILQHTGADTERILFPGGIYVCQHDAVSQSERLCKFRQKGFCPAVRMRLEHTPQCIVRVVLRRLQRCGDLCGMMCIVIDNGNTADLAFILKTSVGAMEIP